MNLIGFILFCLLFIVLSRLFLGGIFIYCLLAQADSNSVFVQTINYSNSSIISGIFGFITCYVFIMPIGIIFGTVEGLFVDVRSLWETFKEKPSRAVDVRSLWETFKEKPSKLVSNLVYWRETRFSWK
jgi:uncharacterized protein YneF (UPF0154 family)